MELYYDYWEDFLELRQDRDKKKKTLLIKIKEVVWISKKNYEFVRFSKKYAITGVDINKTKPRRMTPIVPRAVWWCSW